MSSFLITIPFLAVLSGFLMYRFTGRRDLMKFDLVQFMYAFVISPMLFVWVKTFLFFILKNELNLGLSAGQLFVFDTTLSVLFLYMHAFVVIHTLTKTFDLYRDKDPLYDIFEHTEFFHQWVSHFAIYVGGMSIVLFVSMVNIYLPAALVASNYVLYAIMLFGAIAGLFMEVAIWLYETEDPLFHKVMKLVVGIFFLIHVILYFMADPKFSIQYLGYWFAFSLFLVMASVSLFAEKTIEKKRFGFLPFNLNWRKPSNYVVRLNRNVKQVLRYTRGA